ncbi:hypothetical protein AB1N83_012010 [Pleurotus pulmonarius]
MYVIQLVTNSSWAGSDFDLLGRALCSRNSEVHFMTTWSTVVLKEEWQGPPSTYSCMPVPPEAPAPLDPFVDILQLSKWHASLRNHILTRSAIEPITHLKSGLNCVTLWMYRRCEESRTSNQRGVWHGGTGWLSRKMQKLETHHRERVRLIAPHLHLSSKNNECGCSPSDFYRRALAWRRCRRRYRVECCAVPIWLRVKPALRRFNPPAR